MRTIFPTKRPFFDSHGNLYFPKDIKFAGEVKPKLTAREWMTLIYLQAKNAPKDLKESMCGSRTTQWRTIKKLKKKGYLSNEF